MLRVLRLWTEETAEDVAEYAAMLAIILVLVVGGLARLWFFLLP